MSELIRCAEAWELGEVIWYRRRGDDLTSITSSSIAYLYTAAAVVLPFLIAVVVVCGWCLQIVK